MKDPKICVKHMETVVVYDGGVFSACPLCQALEELHVQHKAREQAFNNRLDEALARERG